MALTRTQKLVAASLRLDGMPIREIARVLHVSHQALAVQFREMAQRQKFDPHIKRIRNSSIVKHLQEENMPLDVLAEKTGYSADALCNAIFLLGEMTEEMKEKIANALNINVSMLDEDVEVSKRGKSIYPAIDAEMRARNISIAELAKSIGIPYGTVYSTLHLNPKRLLQENECRNKIANLLNLPVSEAFALPWGK